MSSSVVTPSELAAVAVKRRTPVLGLVTETEIVSPMNAEVGGVSGIEPVGLFCKNLVVSSMNTFMARGWYSRPLTGSVLVIVFA